MVLRLWLGALMTGAYINKSVSQNKIQGWEPGGLPRDRFMAERCAILHI